MFFVLQVLVTLRKISALGPKELVKILIGHEGGVAQPQAELGPPLITPTEMPEVGAKRVYL